MVMFIDSNYLAKLGKYPGGIYLPTRNTRVVFSYERVGIYPGIYPDTLGIYLPVPNTALHSVKYATQSTILLLYRMSGSAHQPFAFPVIPASEPFRFQCQRQHIR